MIITPHLGIGDLLIVKMKQISNNLDIDYININKGLILQYCENYEIKINFITKIASGTLILATGDKHVKVKIRLTDWKKAKEIIEAEREKVIKDKIKLQKKILYSPIKPSEITQSGARNRFPVEEANE